MTTKMIKMMMMRMTKMMMMSSKVKRGWVAVGVDVRIYRHDLLRAASHHQMITFT